MREVTDHRVCADALNRCLRVDATDDPAPPDKGGANHRYQLSIMAAGQWEKHGASIRFQEGPVVPIVPQGVDPPGACPNGWSQEALLAIVIDRLRGFQGGNFACRENAIALTKLEEALLWLSRRAFDRISRGVEGSYRK